MADRETSLDHRPHPLQDIVLDIPDVPPLCDSLPVRKQRIDVGDCTLYCEEEGSGTPIVLLHGGPGATHHVFHPAFSGAAERARVIYYDQRGCGQSDYEPGAGYSVSQAVDDLDRLREALGFVNWVVLGHSNGGLLAQCYAVRYPERVKGLVLVAASTAFTDLPYSTRQFDSAHTFPEERALISRLYNDSSLTIVQQLYNGHRNGDWRRQSFYRPTDADLARMARYECVHDVAYRTAMLQSNGRVVLDHAFEDCPLPTMIMEGRRDLSSDEGRPERMLPYFHGATLRVFVTAAHNPFDDEPETFFAELRTFVENLSDVPQEEIATWRETVPALE